MEQSVTIKYRWTAEELLRAQRYHFRHIYPAVARFAAHGLFALLLVAGVWGLVVWRLRRGEDRFMPLSISFVVLGIYWFTLRGWERRWMTRRRFSKRPDKDAEVEWQVAPERIATRSGLGHSEFGWPA